MGLKDLFRRKSAKPGKGAKPTGDPRQRGADEATLFLEDDDFASARDHERATGDTPVAATEMMRIPSLDPPAEGRTSRAKDRAEDVTTERLATPDADATVVAPLPDFDQSPRRSTPPASSAASDATVVFSTQGTGIETGPHKRPADAGDAAATVAVSIPNFDETGSAGVPHADVDTQELRTIDANTARKTAIDAAAGSSATVAVSIPTIDEAETPPSPPPAATADATVAVSIPSFDEREPTEPLPALDATVAVPIADLDRALGPAEELESPDAGADATVAVPIADLDRVLGSSAELESPDAGAAATVAVPLPVFEDASESSLDDENSPLADATIAAAVMSEVELEESGSDPKDETRFDLPEAPNRRTAVTGVLVAIDGDLIGTVCPIPDGETKLGRSESCDIVLASMKISRQHSTIVHQDGVFAILPLSEQNPTYVNDDVITGCELADGDSVRMGRTTFRFRTIQGL